MTITVVTITVTTITVMTIMTMTLTTILNNVTVIVIREQILELGTRESEVERIFAGLRQAVSSKVFYQNGPLLMITLVILVILSLQRFLIRMGFV